jgi:putative ABC transport system permease protein
MDVLKMVLGQSMSVVPVGVVVGLIGAAGLTQLMTTLLYNVSATDAATFAGYSAALVLVGLLVSYVSARATRIDVVSATCYVRRATRT